MTQTDSKIRFFVFWKPHRCLTPHPLNVYMWLLESVRAHNVGQTLVTAAWLPTSCPASCAHRSTRWELHDYMYGTPSHCLWCMTSSFLMNKLTSNEVIGTNESCWTNLFARHKSVSTYKSCFQRDISLLDKPICKTQVCFDSPERPKTILLHEFSIFCTRTDCLSQLTFSLSFREKIDFECIKVWFFTLPCLPAGYAEIFKWAKMDPPYVHYTKFWTLFRTLQ